jgi:chromosome segregation ATPase
LFTASERLKVEYRNVQEELKNVRTESRTLRLGHTEMQGELNSTSDLVAGLHLENAKLQQKCDMLFEMNHSLDSDRRALMDHVSQLLTQYHSLLTHSLEDKQHYHLEEKLYTDKVNNLCRQKEKLEEKIMEHYRKLDNASCKKRGFGATLVRKVRKAGSDIINKVPSRVSVSVRFAAG